MFWRRNKASSFIAYAIVLFVIFDGIALGLNVWITEKIQNHAVELNLAGRQRMLTQKIVKEFLSTPPGAASSERLALLAQSTTLFDRTLNAFRQGGTTVNTDNSLVTIKSFSPRPYSNIIETSWTIWSPLRESIYQYTKTPTPELFIRLNQQLQEHNLTLLNNMNDLAFAIESQARSETYQIRVYQAVALALAILNFIAASVFYRRRVKELENEHSLIDALLNDMPSAMVFTDSEGYLLNENPRFIELLGISQTELKQHRIQDLITPDENNSGFWTLSDIAFNRARLKVEQSCATDGEQAITVWRIEDVSRDCEKQEQLASLAFTDPLTKLHNRAAFEQHLKEVTPALSSAHKHCLMFIDLDGFKQVNDLFGHNKGDQVLKEVGTRLQAFCEQNACVARRGGDEFTLLATNLETHNQAEKLAKSIIEALSAPYTSLENQLDISASIGLVIFNNNQSNLLELINTADHAMYMAKQSSEPIRIHTIDLTHD